MVNIDDFIKRLEILLNYYNLSASTFADKIGVQRSSLSHLLSGRNKPSLDLILKIVNEFPEVDLYWILNGKGEFPSTEIKNKTTTPTLPLENQNTAIPENQADLFSNQTEFKKNSLNEIFDEKISTTQNQEIDRIIIFFKDGTFKNYQN